MEEDYPGFLSFLKELSYFLSSFLSILHSAWLCEPVAPLAPVDGILLFVWFLGLSAWLDFSFLTILQFHVCTLSLSFSLT